MFVMLLFAPSKKYQKTGENMNLNNEKRFHCKNDLTQLFKEKLFFSFLLFIIIILFMGLYRRTVILPFFTLILENINGFFLVVFYMNFPIFSFCIPLLFSFVVFKKKKKRKLIFFDVIITLFICFIFIFFIPKLESTVSNTDVTTPKYVIKSKDTDRRSNFIWLRISIFSMTFGQIISDFKKEEE